MAAKKTGFYEIHKNLGAKIIEFAGYYMPIQYRGILDEHKRVRTTVGLFDVSHMGEFFFQGSDALSLIQKLTVNDASKLSVYQAHYSAMCYPDGGMVDDLIVYRFPDKYMMIANAANLAKDWEWINSKKSGEVQITNDSDDLSLLALQGPDAEATLRKLTDVDLSAINFYWFAEARAAGIDMMISRTGYTGEPGFELMFPIEHSEKVWIALMQAGKEYDIEPVGLGARDTLRLEMKYCLYGNDIDQTTNPLEAGLGWITKLDKGDFIGKDALLKVKEKGITRKLIGFEVNDRKFPRHGYKIFKNNKEIGFVTSGTFSPILKKGFGMGYVDAKYSAIGQAIDIDIREQFVPANVVKTPFYQK